jgi:hypothetical protein
MRCRHRPVIAGMTMRTPLIDLLPAKRGRYRNEIYRVTMTAHDGAA